MRRFGSTSIPRLASCSRAFRAISRQRTIPARFAGCWPRKTFSATVRSGAMLSSWCTIAMPDARRRGWSVRSRAAGSASAPSAATSAGVSWAGNEAVLVGAHHLGRAADLGQLHRPAERHRLERGERERLHRGAEQRHRVARREQRAHVLVEAGDQHLAGDAEVARARLDRRAHRPVADEQGAGRNAARAPARRPRPAAGDSSPGETRRTCRSRSRRRRARARGACACALRRRRAPVLGVDAVVDHAVAAAAHRAAQPGGGAAPRTRTPGSRRSRRAAGSRASAAIPWRRRAAWCGTSPSAAPPPPTCAARAPRRTGRRDSPPPPPRGGCA